MTFMHSPRKRIPSLLAALPFLWIWVSAQAKGSGTEAAAFLDIPVGAQPASLGGAYTAWATDAYAPLWNPAGLGRIRATQLAAQHLSYLDSINYESISAAWPF